MLLWVICLFYDSYVSTHRVDPDLYRPLCLGYLHSIVNGCYICVYSIAGQWFSMPGFEPQAIQFPTVWVDLSHSQLFPCPDLKIGYYCQTSMALASLFPHLDIPKSKVHPNCFRNYGISSSYKTFIPELAMSLTLTWWKSLIVVLLQLLGK